MPLLERDDLIWIHDFHLIPLAARLRPMGVTQPLGFFLHISMPIEERRARHAAMMRTLSSSDIGIWRRSFVDALTATAGRPSSR